MSNIIDPKSYAVAYWNMKPFWTDCINLKEPLSTTLPFYLNKYSKEDNKEYSDRVKRLAQVNFIDLVIDAYCSMLFSTDVRITAKNNQDAVDAFVENCNLQGDSLKEYCREIIAPSAFLYGVTDVVVEMDNAEIRTKADETTPYCYIIPPLNRVNWTLSDAKQFTSYRSVDTVNTENTAMGTRDPQQFREWSLLEYTTFDQNGDNVVKKPNPFKDDRGGFIPIVSVIPLPSMRFYSDRMGQSLVQNTVGFQKMVINLISLIFDFHEQVNYALRVINVDPNMGEVPDESEDLEGGNRRTISLLGADMKLLTPDPRGVESMAAFLGTIIELVYQDVRISSDANVNKTHQSTGTIRGNMAPLYNRMTRISKHFEKAYKQIIEMALKVQGIDPVKAGVKVQWGTNFSFESFANAIEELTSLRAVLSDISPTAIGEMSKKTIQPALYNSDQLEVIDKEIDDWVVKANAGEVGPTPAMPLPTDQQSNSADDAAQKVTDQGGD